MYTLKTWKDAYSRPVTRTVATYKIARALVNAGNYKTQIISSFGVVEFEIKYPI